MKKTGFILGKFMPPHLGHMYLVNFARSYVDELFVLVEKVPGEPIPSEKRFEWMKQLFPDVQVLHFTAENPQSPSEHPNFWDIWKNSLEVFLPIQIDCVFTSESYGGKLAEILGAEHIMVDPLRQNVPISASDIRHDPLANWDYLPPVIQKNYLKRICIFGPESTGKTTLARNLAQHFDTIYVPEYARTLLEASDGKISYADIHNIARGQMASEKALAGRANKLLFCDTDLLTTSIWSHELFRKCPAWISSEVDRNKYNLYLLLDIDVPWVRDNVRYFPEQRKGFFNTCKDRLIRTNRNFVVIEGDWEKRFQRSVEAIEKICPLTQKVS